MSSLLPVVVGLAAGIGLFIAFAMYFNPAMPHSSSYNSNLARIAAFVDADCIDAECTAEMVTNCEGVGDAIVPYGDNRVWVIRLEERYQFCHIVLYDMNVEGGFSDFFGYDCGISHVELAGLEGKSFSEIIPNAIKDPRWTCGTFAP